MNTDSVTEFVLFSLLLCIALKPVNITTLSFSIRMCVRYHKLRRQPVIVFFNALKNVPEPFNDWLVVADNHVIYKCYILIAEMDFFKTGLMLCYHK